MSCSGRRTARHALEDLERYLVLSPRAGREAGATVDGADCASGTRRQRALLNLTPRGHATKARRVACGKGPSLCSTFQFGMCPRGTPFVQGKHPSRTPHSNLECALARPPSRRRSPRGGSRWLPSKPRSMSAASPCQNTPIRFNPNTLPSNIGSAVTVEPPRVGTDSGSVRSSL